MQVALYSSKVGTQVADLPGKGRERAAKRKTGKAFVGESAQVKQKIDGRRHRREEKGGRESVMRESV
jgi:hypothetical protein